MPLVYNLQPWRTEPQNKVCSKNVNALLRAAKALRCRLWPTTDSPTWIIFRHQNSLLCEVYKMLSELIMIILITILSILSQ